MRVLICLALFWAATNAFAGITVQSISGADAVWTGYLESHITFCNQRSSDNTLQITYKSVLPGEARLVDAVNKTLWQKPKVLANEWVTLEIPWNQICSSMGNRKCRNPQYNQFKFGMSSNSDSLLEDFHVLYVQVIDRCQPSN